MIGFSLLPLLLAVWPASAQDSQAPFSGTTLSFLNSDQISDCPAASSLPSFRTTAAVPARAFICLDVADLFTHPNRTNVTRSGIDIPYQLTNINSWSSSGNFSGLRYTNAYTGPSKTSGPATYWITFYAGEGCLQMDEPWMSFSCAETEGKCFQFPFNIASFSLKPASSDSNDDCSLNVAEGDPNSMAGRIGTGYGIPAALSALTAVLLMV